MSSLWVSHSSDSTGQMIALDKVVKIRTFKQNKDSRIIYRMVFETTYSVAAQVTWDFGLRDSALQTVERIAQLVEPGNADPRETQIYKDLAKGFD